MSTADWAVQAVNAMLVRCLRAVALEYARRTAELLVDKKGPVH